MVLSARWRLAGFAPVCSRPRKRWPRAIIAVHDGDSQELSRSLADDGEVLLQLGLCELHQGRPEAALAAWDRIEASSPYAAPAAVERTTVAIEPGGSRLPKRSSRRRLGQATPHDKLRLLQKLAMLFEIEGRTDDMRTALLESWRYTDAPQALIRKLSRQELAKLPLLTLRQYLEKGESDDPRVWLGRGLLACRTGQLDAAAKWLDLCVSRAPDDPVVWRERGSSRRRPLAISPWPGRRLEHLPAPPHSDIELARIRVWVAGAKPDIAALRNELLALIKQDPGDIAAINQLAALAARAGDNDEVRRLHARAADLTRHQRTLPIADSRRFPGQRPGRARPSRSTARPR